MHRLKQIIETHDWNYQLNVSHTVFIFSSAMFFPPYSGISYGLSNVISITGTGTVIFCKGYDVTLQVNKDWILQVFQYKTNLTLPLVANSLICRWVWKSHNKYLA